MYLDKDKKNCQGVAAHTFNPSRRQRQVDLCEFEVILIYRESTAKTVTQRNLFLKKKKRRRSITYTRNSVLIEVRLVRISEHRCNPSLFVMNRCCKEGHSKKSAD